MEYELFKDGDSIGKFDSIDSVENKISDIVKFEKDYLKHDSLFSENGRDGKIASHLVHTRIFKTAGKMTTTSFKLITNKV